MVPWGAFAALLVEGEISGAACVNEHKLIRADSVLSAFFCRFLWQSGGLFIILITPLLKPARRPVSTKNVRVNSQIRISPIRLVDDQSNQLGIVELEDAREMARERELDLVEVAPNARPPVVRIMDYGKFKYRESKKAREAKKKQHVIQMKEIKLRSKIDDHDLAFKIRHARKFLEKQNKVKVTMVFRGREVVHKGLGEDVLHRFFDAVSDLGVKEGMIKMEGRNMILILLPQSIDKA